ncbi:stalk domain-containing protein [Paenibacillus septentrionalis]|uniref:Stalk domain-containing protein n=1 Tax=Paenibacillus septentrionalis TaxID=429342 RepID=A0ABW1UX94_9BACL
MKQKLLAFATIVSCSAVLAMAPIAERAVEAAATKTSQVIFYLDQKEAYRNGELVVLDSPATAIAGKSYLPAKFLGDSFGMKVSYDSQTKNVTLISDQVHIVFDIAGNTITVNDEKMSNDNIARIINGRIMVQLTWLCDYMGASYTYTPAQKKVMVTYVPKAEENIDEALGSAPVAKFSVDKASYAIGETITYTNLSYDPDSEGVSLSWTNKQDAFFTPGEHQVSLVAIDRNGNKSEPYTRTIMVTDKVLFEEFEYGVYTSGPGGYIKATDELFNASVLSIPEASKTVQYATDRKLLVSDSPEIITKQGILYEDSINGKARLYANHVNESGQSMEFAILATNNTTKPITLKTTNQGEVYPSKYAMLLGSEAVIDFLMYNQVNEAFTVAPGETIVYRQFPTFRNGYGMNTVYDVESSGELLVSFVAASKIDRSALALPKLAYNGHVRGSFSQSDITWTVDPSKQGKTRVQRLVIGDGTSDPFIKGYDPLRKEQTTLSGNYGAVYHMTIKKPGNMAIMVMARGGQFKGAFKVNGQFVRVPASGVLTPFDGLVTIAKTKESDEQVTIEFSPPAGSSFPLNLILYPLDARVKQLQ